MLDLNKPQKIELDFLSSGLYHLLVRTMAGDYNAKIVVYLKVAGLKFYSIWFHKITESSTVGLFSLLQYSYFQKETDVK